MSFGTSYKPARLYQSGRQGQEPACIWDRHQNTHDRLRLYSTSRPAWSRHSTTSASITSSRPSRTSIDAPGVSGSRSATSSRSRLHHSKRGSPTHQQPRHHRYSTSPHQATNLEKILRPPATAVMTRRPTPWQTREPLSRRLHQSRHPFLKSNHRSCHRQQHGPADR